MGDSSYHISEGQAWPGGLQQVARLHQPTTVLGAARLASAAHARAPPEESRGKVLASLLLRQQARGVVGGVPDRGDGARCIQLGIFESPCERPLPLRPVSVPADVDRNARGSESALPGCRAESSAAALTVREHAGRGAVDLIAGRFVLASG